MEGPSLVIITSELAQFIGHQVKQVSGNTTAEKGLAHRKELKRIRSWGKHLLLEFDDFFIRIHFLMYGSYRVNERKEQEPRLSLIFDNGEVNFYSCSVKVIDDHTPEEIYDWRVDVMSPQWDADYVLKKIKGCDHEKVCDVLMDQNIFAGVGNIIKNEVLFNLHLHPDSTVDALSKQQLKDLITEAHDYSHNFYKWNQEFTLKKHWQVMRKKICPRNNIPLIKKKTGKLQRWSFYCTKCQVLHS